MDTDEIADMQDVEGETFLIHTAGYFYEKTEDFTYIAQSYDTNEAKKFDSIIAIPNVAIRSIRKL